MLICARGKATLEAGDKLLGWKEELLITVCLHVPAGAGPGASGARNLISPHDHPVQ